MHAISINEQSFEVRSNCRHALLQARSYGGSQHYWVDAICIDQEDQDEKSDQVRMMGEIFDRATNVLSCIGEAENDSEKVMKMLVTIPEDLVVDVWPGRELDSKMMAWLSAQSHDDTECFSDSLTALLLRPYFTRVWILQEVFLKQSKTVLCCGVQYAPFKALFALKRALYHSQHLKGEWASYASYDFPSRCSSFLLDVSFLGQRTSNTTEGVTTRDGKDGLEEALEMASAFGCTDVRDRIYGILSLIDWASEKPIYPNYHKSRYDLVLEIVEVSWPKGRFATIERMIMLIRMFELVDQNASSSQFEETASTIVTRCQEPQLGQTQDGEIEHKRQLFRLKLQNLGEKPLKNGQHGAFVVIHSLIKEAMASRDRRMRHLGWPPNWYFGESSGGSDVSPQSFSNQRDYVVLSVRANRDGELWITSLQLICDAEDLNRTARRIPSQSYDLFLAAEDALIISFVMASTRTVPKPAIKSFLKNLKSAHYRFSSYAKILQPD